ncbi:dipeptide ABC transporter ATP-binding protein [Embleya sp. AB8]|uniref:dipeptide ABC transporter ATP-binding protein n=1 Tax=Embleya sp. AB8 TaxID=3156304 RepID=UPI003C731B24
MTTVDTTVGTEREPEQAARAAVLRVDGLRVELAGTGADVVAEVDFAVAPGEIVAVVGESGSGKTTVATALLGHARRGATITGGRVRLADTDLLAAGPDELRRLRGTRISYVPQDPATALDPGRRIRSHLAEVLAVHRPELDRRARRSAVAAALAEVGLPADDAFARRFPHQLSGGQQQRVLLALAFVLRPRVIVLDEPTTALDVSTQARVLATVRELCRAHDVAAVYVSHDLAVVRHLADRVVVLYAGRVVEEAPTAELFAKPRHPYTRGLLAAAPDAGERRTPTAIPGRAPQPGRRPSGCAFAPRCASATPTCATAPTLSGDARRVSCHHPVGPAAPVDVEPPIAIPPFAGPVVLEASGVHAGYAGRSVLHDVSVRLTAGACVAVVGESGSGKTTFARALAGLGEPTAGTLHGHGEPLAWPAAARPAQARRRIQYVFQNPYRALNPRLTVRRTLAAPIRHFFAPGREETERLVVEALARVSLPAGTADAHPRELSGGERQRVAIARALVCRPEVLICDEITSALDVSVQAAILDLLAGLRADGLAVLFVTHDLGVVRTVADEVTVLAAGRVVEHGPTAEVLDHPTHPYTRALIADSPHHGIAG